MRKVYATYGWMWMVFRYFQSMPGKWKHAKCYPISIRCIWCGMMRWCWRRRRPCWWWWKCNVQNIIYSNTVFVYKSAVMCHFHGNHVSNSLSLSLPHLLSLCELFDPFHRGPLPIAIDRSEMRLWANYQFSYICYFFPGFVQAKRNTIYSLISPLFYCGCVRTTRGFAENTLDSLPFSDFHWKQFFLSLFSFGFANCCFFLSYHHRGWQMRARRVFFLQMLSSWL